jgi:hypothetical protein
MAAIVWTNRCSKQANKIVLEKRESARRHEIAWS